MTDAGAQKALWEVRKAGLNIMMCMRGDGKPVSFIEDCAVPLEHLAEYTSRLTEVFARHGTRGTWYAHASVGTLHVRPILDMRRGGAEKMRAIAEEAGALVRQYKGAFSGEHGDGLVRSEWVAWQFGPRLLRAFEEIKDLFDPAGPDEPGQDRARHAHGRQVAVPLQARLPADRRCKPALDWSAWNVQVDPVTEQSTRARHRRRPGRRLRQGRRDVQQQRPLPQVRRRHHVPELPRDEGRAAPDPRARQHAAPGPVRPAGRRRFTSEAMATRWTCASAARAASANARPASTWRA